jgi:hypothetical protein
MRCLLFGGCEFEKVLSMMAAQAWCALEPMPPQNTGSSAQVRRNKCRPEAIPQPSLWSKKSSALRTASRMPWKPVPRMKPLSRGGNTGMYREWKSTLARTAVARPARDKQFEAGTVRQRSSRLTKWHGLNTFVQCITWSLTSIRPVRVRPHAKQCRLEFKRALGCLQGGNI